MSCILRASTKLRLGAEVVDRQYTNRHMFTRQNSSFQSPTSVEHMKRPRRRGQNLYSRYQRLERSLREKAALSEFIEDLPGDRTVTSTPDREIHPVHRPPGTVKTFRGFVIPEEPRPPAADECCMSGCAICVYDLYEESRQAYKASIDALRSTLKASNVPENEWPPSIRETRDTSAESKSTSTKDVTMSAFEELERMLSQKRAAVS